MSCRLTSTHTQTHTSLFLGITLGVMATDHREAMNECPYIAKTHRDKKVCECGQNVSTICWRLNSSYWQASCITKIHAHTSEEVSGKNRKLDHTLEKKTTEQNSGKEKGRKSPLHTPFCLSYLDSFYPKSQSSCWAYGLSPLHVSGFGHRLLVVLLCCRCFRVDLDHFLEHVGPRRRLLPSLGQLFL